MDWAKKLRNSIIARAGRPPSPKSIDVRINNAGGVTTAWDLTREQTQAKKTSVSPQERIVELSREIGCVREELAFFRGLADDLEHFLPIVQYHVKALWQVIQEADKKITQANEAWVAEGEKRRASRRIRSSQTAHT